MGLPLSLLRLGIVVCLTMLTATCATPPRQAPERARSLLPASSAHTEDEARVAAPHQPPHESSSSSALPVGIRELGNGSIQVFFPPRPVPPELGTLSVAEARLLREALEVVRPSSEPRLRLLEVPGPRAPPRSVIQPLQLRMREEFIAEFGPGVLPLSNSPEGTPLWAALKMAPRFMGEGVRQAADYQETQVARTPEQVEAASARFGMEMGGVGFRVVVLVATLGLGRLLPDVPGGGVAGEVRSWSAALAGRSSVGSITTAQVVADGTLVVSGASAGLAISATCVDMGVCSMASNSSLIPAP